MENKHQVRSFEYLFLLDINGINEDLLNRVNKVVHFSDLLYILHLF